tara:strand:- start:3287 stop:3481 length:195 start_codon:yes stop_codon:yes gene_type:complete
LGAWVESHEGIEKGENAEVFQQDVSDRVQGFVALPMWLDENTEATCLASNSRSCSFELIYVSTS